MNDILIYSDPHIGLSRKAHFTPSSNDRREAYIYAQLSSLLSSYQESICLGDFFDKRSNPERILLDAVPLWSKTTCVLAGNHDVGNAEEVKSSLDVMSKIKEGVAVLPSYQCSSFVRGNTLFCMVPHALTQEAYDEAINRISEEAANYSGYRVLCLHCNWNLPDAFGNDSTLNLTQERAYELLHTYHHIWIGHQHTAEDAFEGRVRVVGSVCPTAFDNMDDKRVLVYEPYLGEVRERRTWDKAQHFLSCKASEAPAPGEAELQYLELDDDLAPGEAQKLAVAWLNSEAFGVRILPKKAESGAGELLAAPSMGNLRYQITQELKENRPHLVNLWKEVSGGEDADQR